MGSEPANEDTVAMDAVGTAPVVAVVQAVAAVSDQDPLEMDPLYDAIDTDALNALCATGDGERSGVTISFPYNGYQVSVTSNERLSVVCE